MRPFRLKLLSLSMASCSILAALFGALCPAAQADTFKILHKPVASAELPDPESPMIIKFSVNSSRELERTVRALITKDGRLIEVPLLKSYLNEKDYPTYEFQFNAPIAELNYQFVAYDGQGGAVHSEHYAVRRSCLPALQITDLSSIKDLTPDEQLKTLFDRTVRLSEEIEQYEQSVKSIEHLQKLLKE